MLPFKCIHYLIHTIMNTKLTTMHNDVVSKFTDLVLSELRIKVKSGEINRDEYDVLFDNLMNRISKSYI